MSEQYTREQAEAMGAFHEDALTLEDVLDDQKILDRIERGEDVTGEHK